MGSFRARILLVGIGFGAVVVGAASAIRSSRPSFDGLVWSSAADPISNAAVVLDRPPKQQLVSVADPACREERTSAVFVPGLVTEIENAPPTVWSPGEHEWFLEQLATGHAQYENPQVSSSAMEYALQVGNEARRNALTEDAVDEAARQLIGTAFVICTRAQVSWSNYSSEPMANRYAERAEYRTIVDGRVHEWSARNFPVEAQLIDELETSIADGSSSIFETRPLRRAAVLGLEALARKRLSGQR